MKYFKPLLVFVIISLLTLGLTVFLPAVNTATQALSSNPAVSSGHYWGLTNVVTGTRMIIMIIGFGMALALAAITYLKNKD